jgi:prepilin-type N-terminal cleavage/methylation domain-containing protein
MRIADYRRERGFTLVEMLAAVIAAVVIIGAATGFMLTATIRQYKVIGANTLEASHENLAETMLASIKSATAFQIYTADPGVKFGLPLPPGEPAGNLLICVRAGLIEEFAYSDGEIIYTSLDGGPSRSKSFGQVSPNGGLAVFDTKLGIIQAHWNVATSVDLVPFSVYGLPLPMR